MLGIPFYFFLCLSLVLCLSLPSMTAPRVVRAATVALSEISVSHESGWRDVDPVYIQKMVEGFMAGDFGFCVMTPPSIIDGAVAAGPF